MKCNYHLLSDTIFKCSKIKVLKLNQFNSRIQPALGYIGKLSFFFLELIGFFFSISFKRELQKSMFLLSKLSLKVFSHIFTKRTGRLKKKLTPLMVCVLEDLKTLTIDIVKLTMLFKASLA